MLDFRTVVEWSEALKQQYRRVRAESARLKADYEWLAFRYELFSINTAKEVAMKGSNFKNGLQQTVSTSAVASVALNRSASPANAIPTVKGKGASPAAVVIPAEGTTHTKGPELRRVHRKAINDKFGDAPEETALLWGVEYCRTAAALLQYIFWPFMGRPADSEARVRAVRRSVAA